MMHIDDKTYWIDDKNRYDIKTTKTQIVLASSLRKDSNHISRLKHKDFGKSKKWNTFTITRNGIVYQHYDPNYYSDFIGIKLADKQSITIVLENMGYLIETADNKYVNWVNEVCNDENIIERIWMGYNFWEKFTDEQILSTVVLCKKLCEEFGITKNVIDFRNYHKDIIKYKGIVFRSNFFEETGDINPNLNIPKLNEMLHNEFI